MINFQRIVLVDDNEADNVYHEIMIRRAGFNGEVVVFEMGIDALAWLEATDHAVPTCIFLDINMPMLNGFEVAERAAPLIEGKQHIILMMLTSSSSPADKAKALAMPVILDFVTKPLTVDKVKEIVGPAPAQ